MLCALKLTPAHIPVINIIIMVMITIISCMADNQTSDDNKSALCKHKQKSFRSSYCCT